MFELIKQYRREFVYSSYLFLIFELLVTPSFSVNIFYFSVVALVGYVLINIWLLSTYQLHSARRVSQYSDVLLRVNLWERLFSYVLLPLLFYTAVVTFLLFSPSSTLNQIVTVISVFLFFYLFLYVRTSYEKVYSVHRMTRVSTDFVSIVVYFMTLSVLSHVLVDKVYFALILFFFTLFCFIYILYHHNKFEINSILLGLVSAVVITFVYYNSNFAGPYALSAILSVLYYLVVSLWNVRFSGSTALGDYIPPVMYSVMAIILILGL